MSREEKKRKLSNAVREYRGVCTQDFKKWLHAPNKAAADRVRMWLARLEIDVELAMVFIDDCKTWDQFRTWISSI